MKIISTATAVALLFGASAIMQASATAAMRDNCNQLAQACQAGNQSACQAYLIGCSANPGRLGSVLGSAPTTENNYKFDAASLNSRQNASATK